MYKKLSGFCSSVVKISQHITSNITEYTNVKFLFCIEDSKELKMPFSFRFQPVILI